MDEKNRREEQAICNIPSEKARPGNERRDLRRLATGAFVSLALHATLVGLGAFQWGFRGVGVGAAETSAADASPSDAVVITRRVVKVASAKSFKTMPKETPKAVVAHPKAALVPVASATPPPSPVPSAQPSPHPAAVRQALRQNIPPVIRRPVPLPSTVLSSRPMDSVAGNPRLAQAAPTRVVPTFRLSHRRMTPIAAGSLSVPAPSASALPSSPSSGEGTPSSSSTAAAAPSPSADAHSTSGGASSGTTANTTPPASSGGAGRGVPFASGSGGGGAGLGPDAARVAYVLDVSESMNENDKIGAARGALLQAIGGLRSSDRFTIILFSDNVTPLSSGLIAASDTAAVKHLEDRFVATAPYGETDLSDALDAAFNLPGIQRIFLLSDGAPTLGINDYDELRAHLRERNAGGRVRISTYALGAGEQFEGVQLLRQIAEENNGEYRYVKIGGG